MALGTRFPKSKWRWKEVPLNKGESKANRQKNMTQSRERLKQLEEIEKDIVKVIESAGHTILELSKEAPSEDVVVSKATEFVKSLEGVEKGLTEQINYLTQVATGQPHEGSAYGVQKGFELSCSRISQVRKQLQDIQQTNKELTSTNLI